MMMMMRLSGGAGKMKNRRASKGHFVVYVGEGMRRFEVPLSYLKTPPFQQLLDKAADEFGFQYSHNGIVLPCDQSTFHRILELAAAAAATSAPSTPSLHS